MEVDDVIWKNLLKLKEVDYTKEVLGWGYKDASFSEIRSYDTIHPDLEAILFKVDHSRDLDTIVSQHKNIETPFEGFSFFESPSIDSNISSFLQNYWALGVLHALNLDLPYILIHSAISLDGFMATQKGHSHWIGNEENLIHAHRLRALFDGVLVGANTVLNDKPLLNVRRVQGNNPKRLILSNRCKDFSSLNKDCSCETYLLRDVQYGNDLNQGDFDKVLLFEGDTTKDKMLDLLHKCKEENIKSILIEGGAATLSTFVETKLAHNIQFHISPLLFGSGIKAVNLPEVNTVNEANKLKNMCVTPVGNSFMITAGLS